MLSQESMAMSTQISVKLLSGESRQTNVEAEELRRNYLAIITRNDWHEQLVMVARDVAARVQDPKKNASAEQGSVQRRIRERESEDEDGFTIAFQDTLHEAQATDFVLCGRMKECHIRLSDAGASRVHAIVLLIPKSLIIVVDVGSAKGIVTVRRSSGGACESSLPNQRSVLTFQWGETAVLGLGVEHVCLNPRLCCVCLEVSLGSS